MIQTPTLTPPSASPALSAPEAWLAWRAEVPTDAGQLSVAELAECGCPDLCNRDHPNE